MGNRPSPGFVLTAAKRTFKTLIGCRILAEYLCEITSALAVDCRKAEVIGLKSNVIYLSHKRHTQVILYFYILGMETRSRGNIMIINRRDILGLTVMATSLVLPTHSFSRERVMKDCGWPESETCRIEAQIENERRAHEAKKRKLAQQKYNNWQDKIKAEAQRIFDNHDPKYANFFIAGPKTGTQKLTRTAVLDANGDTRTISIRAYPLPDINGKIADKAYFDVWRKRGFAGIKNVAENVDTLFLSEARANRSYRMGAFRTNCVVLWEAGKIIVPSGGDPGCEPYPCIE